MLLFGSVKLNYLIVLQTVVILIGFDLTLFWADLYLSKHEGDFMINLTKKDFAWAKKFHGNFQLIDDLHAINDGGEFPCKEICSRELESKLDYSGSHATFLDLDINQSSDM